MTDDITSRDTLIGNLLDPVAGNREEESLNWLILLRRDAERIDASDIVVKAEKRSA